VEEEAGCGYRHPPLIPSLPPSLPSHTVGPSFFLLVLVPVVLLLLQLPERIEAFALPAAICSRRRTPIMTQAPKQHEDGEQLSTRAHVLFQSAAAVTGGLLLSSVTTGIGGVQEAQAVLEPIVSQTYMEQVRDGTCCI